MNKLIKLIATFGGLGYSKIAPGTTGCLGGAVVYLLVRQNIILYSASLLVLLLLGFAVSGKAENIFRAKDAKPIVIDDACGLLISLFMVPFSLTNFIIVFLLFRTIDIIKPFPIRKVERLPGSLGIMADDIIAGLFCNIVYRLSLKILFS